MAGSVIVQTTSSGQGAPVAIEAVGGADFQLVKLVNGLVGASDPIIATSATPAAGEWGMVVRQAGSIGISGPVQVSTGTVSISGPVTISPTVLTVNTAATIAGASVTIQQGASVSLGGLANVVVTTTATSGASGPLVWLGHNQTLATIGTIVTQLGTQVVSVVPGLSVNVGSQATGVYTTTATSGVTGPIVWLGVGQTLATIGTLSTLLGTLNVNLAAAGTTIPVNVVAGGAAPGTTATTQTNVTAQVVWLAPTQTIHVTIDAGAGGGGSVTTAAPSISATGQVMWVAGGQSTTASPIYVSQINAPAAGGGSVTTTQAAQTGQLMWLAPTQTMALVSTVGTVLGTMNVNLAAAGTTIPVNIVAGGAAPGTTVTGQTSLTAQLVWLAPTQTMLAVSTINTILGTQIVSVVPGVSVSLGGLANVVVTTTASSGQSGALVWLGVGQTIATVATVGTILGTQVVSVVPGLSVSLGGLANAVVTTTATSGVSGPIVWLGANQTIATINTIIGTQIVSVVPGLSVSLGGLANAVVTTTATSGVSGPIVWLGAGQTVATVSTVGTILGTQIVTLATGGSVVALDVGRTQVNLIVTSSSVGISGTMLLFTAYQGITQSAAGTSGFIVPAGKTFRILSAQMVAANSVTTSPVAHRLYVVASTAAPTWTSVVPIQFGVAVNAASATVNYSACAVGIADIAAGVTVGLGYTIATSGGSIVQLIIQGYLFP